VFVSFAVFPYKNFISLAYLVDCLWIVGILIWVVVAWGAVCAVRAIVALARRSAPSLVPPAAGGGPLVGWTGALAVAALAVVGVLGIRPAATRPIEVDWNPQDVALVARAATAIERATPAGPVVVTVGPNTEPTFFLVAWSTEAIAYRLESDGWQPGVTGPAENYTQLAVPTGARWPSFQVTLRGTAVASVRRVR
jgi:hypothetical protein